MSLPKSYTFMLEFTCPIKGRDRLSRLSIVASNPWDAIDVVIAMFPESTTRVHTIAEKKLGQEPKVIYEPKNAPVLEVAKFEGIDG